MLPWTSDSTIENWAHGQGQRIQKVLSQKWMKPTSLPYEIENVWIEWRIIKWFILGSIDWGIRQFKTTLMFMYCSYRSILFHCIFEKYYKIQNTTEGYEVAMF